LELLSFAGCSILDGGHLTLSFWVVLAAAAAAAAAAAEEPDSRAGLVLWPRNRVKEALKTFIAELIQ
jgi:hypothetical protein